MSDFKVRSTRNLRIDAFRLLLMFFVISAHIQIYENPPSLPLYEKIPKLIIIICTRCVIPFFFCISGYFVGGKIVEQPSQAVSIARAYTKRLLIIFLFWSAVYAAIDPKGVINFINEHPVRFIFEGSKLHLWFFTSLILTIWLYVLWPFKKDKWSFFIFGGFLFLCGLVNGAYVTTPIGIDLHIHDRDGIFIGTIFFASGILFRQSMPRINKQIALGIVFGGLIIYVFEAWYLHEYWGVAASLIDYAFGSIPFGIGVFLFAIMQSDSAIEKFVGQYGKYTLGVYVSHMVYVDLLYPVGPYVNPILWHLIFPLGVFGMALATSILLERTFLRRVVI